MPLFDIRQQLLERANKRLSPFDVCLLPFLVYPLHVLAFSAFDKLSQRVIVSNVFKRARLRLTGVKRETREQTTHSFYPVHGCFFEIGAPLQPCRHPRKSNDALSHPKQMQHEFIVASHVQSCIPGSHRVCYREDTYATNTNKLLAIRSHGLAQAMLSH